MNTKENKELWVGKVVDILKIGGRSDNTIINYTSALNRFLNYYNEDVDISKFNEEDVLDYAKSEFLSADKASSTYNANLSAIVLLFLVCFHKEFNRRLLPRSKDKKRLPKILERTRFLEIVNKEKNQKHKCWLLLAFCCGLRVDEVARVMIEDIDTKEFKLKVIGKGNKERYTLLCPLVIKHLRLYYKSKGMIKRNGYLFEGVGSKEYCSSRAISNYFNSVKKKYNLEDEITFHSLRHSFATYFLMKYNDLVTLKEIMGHVSIKTTMKYLHLVINFKKYVGENNG